MTRKAISLNVGHPWKTDIGKSIRKIGANYRPLQESAEDMFQQLIGAG